MNSFEITTDLALEARENISGNEDELRGISVEETYDEESEVRITKVIIDSKNGAKAM